MDKDSTLIVAEVETPVMLATSSTRYAYQGLTAPNHTCKEPRPLRRGDVVVVRNRTATSVLVSRTEGPCRCPFLLHDPVQTDETWVRRIHRGFYTSVAKLRIGGWTATVGALPERGAMATAGPGEGTIVSGDFESEEAAVNAAKKYIDQKHSQRTR